MDNRIELSKEEIENVLQKIRNADNNCFKLVKRDSDYIKDPKIFMINLGIDMTDLIFIIKELKYENYKECILDIKNKYVYLYVFKKKVYDTDAYIKIGFKYDDDTGNVYIISFHEDM